MPSKDYNKEYYQKNKEKLRKKSKEYYEKTKNCRSPEREEAIKERGRKYYLKVKDKNKEKWKITKGIWYQNNKESIAVYNKNWRLENLGQLNYRFRRAKYAAKKRELSFELTFEQFSEIASKPCFYCNGDFCNPVVDGSGLDRLDSKKGYTIDNVVSCGSRCNLIKNDDLSSEEAKAAIEAILKIRNTNYEKI